MKTGSSPNLAAPGAGLPWLELMIARWMVRGHFRKATRAASSELIRQESGTIRSLAEQAGPELAGRQVLIARLRGMEDSSRFWSINMVAEHLRIVNNLVAQTIVELGQGRIPAREASTATVKPAPSVSGKSLLDMEASCLLIGQAIEGIADLTSTPRFPHPWFGPLNAHEWHAMAGFHMRLHRRQIESILHTAAATI